jgi:hypothetical protein
MNWWWIVAMVVVIGMGALFLAWRPLRKLGGAIQIERARELFVLQRELLEPKFLAAAAATGKPRGLRWQECIFYGEATFARDRQSRQLVALVPVTIQFEAVEGSDMEGLPAVNNQRNASAVFFFHGGKWLTAGKAVFNMNPVEALLHFRNQYEAIGQKPDSAQVIVD